MGPYWNQTFGNPTSIHSFGQEAKHALESARKDVANFLNAKKTDEIVFTSGGSEGNALGIRGSLGFGPRGHILTTPIEHTSVLAVCAQLEEEGYEIEFLSVDKDGRVDPQEVRSKIRPNTKLIAVMFANNEVGTIEPVEEIGAITKEKNILFHVDAVQAAGKIPIDVQKIGCTTASISGHKFGAPKGIGALYARSDVKLRALIAGSHEGGRRAGTQNVAFAVALACACKSAKEELALMATQTRALRDSFETKILKAVDNVRVNGHPAARVPNTSNISFEGVEAANMLIALDLEGVAVSSGSSCSSGSTKPSHVLSAMGLEAKYLKSSLRFSLGKSTTQEEIDFTVDALARVVARQRKLVPAS